MKSGDDDLTRDAFDFMQEALECQRGNWSARDGPLDELVLLEEKHPCKPLVLSWVKLSAL